MKHVIVLLVVFSAIVSFVPVTAQQTYESCSGITLGPRQQLQLSPHNDYYWQYIQSDIVGMVVTDQVSQQRAIGLELSLLPMWEQVSAYNPTYDKTASLTVCSLAKQAPTTNPITCANPENIYMGAQGTIVSMISGQEFAVSVDMIVNVSGYAVRYSPGILHYWIYNDGNYMFVPEDLIDNTALLVLCGIDPTSTPTTTTTPSATPTNGFCFGPYNWQATQLPQFIIHNWPTGSVMQVEYKGSYGGNGDPRMSFYHHDGNQVIGNGSTSNRLVLSPPSGGNWSIGQMIVLSGADRVQVVRGWSGGLGFDNAIVTIRLCLVSLPTPTVTTTPTITRTPTAFATSTPTNTALPPPTRTATVPPNTRTPTATRTTTTTPTPYATAVTLPCTNPKQWQPANSAQSPSVRLERGQTFHIAYSGMPDYIVLEIKKFDNISGEYVAIARLGQGTYIWDQDSGTFIVDGYVPSGAPTVPNSQLWTIYTCPLSAIERLQCISAYDTQIAVAPLTTVIQFVQGEQISVDRDIYVNVNGRAVYIPRGKRLWDYPSGSYHVYSLSEPANLSRCDVGTPTPNTTGTPTTPTPIGGSDGAEPIPYTCWQTVDLYANMGGSNSFNALRGVNCTLGCPIDVSAENLDAQLCIDYTEITEFRVLSIDMLTPIRILLVAGLVFTIIYMIRRR